MKKTIRQELYCIGDHPDLKAVYRKLDNISGIPDLVNRLEEHEICPFGLHNTAQLLAMLNSHFFKVRDDRTQIQVAENMSMILEVAPQLLLLPERLAAGQVSSVYSEGDVSQVIEGVIARLKGMYHSMPLGCDLPVS